MMYNLLKAMFVLNLCCGVPHLLADTSSPEVEKEIAFFWEKKSPPQVKKEAAAATPQINKEATILGADTSGPEVKKEATLCGKIASLQKQPCVAPYKFTIGPVYSHVTQSAHKMPTFNGNLWGVLAEFEYKKRNTFYADASTVYNWGTLHGNGGPKSHSTELVAEGDLGYTIAWSLQDRWLASVFTGFGYRRFVNGFDATSRTPAMTVVYENYYVPIGGKLQYDFSRDWRIGLNVKFLPSVDQKLYVEGTTGTYWREGKRPGWDVEVPVTWSKSFCGRNWLEVSAVPFFQFWQLGAATALSFPTWKQYYGGLRIMIGAAF